VVHIKASDLERIPREGSLSADPRDLPAQPIVPTKKLARDRLQRCTVYAVPGILADATASATATPTVEPATALQEMSCKPVKVVNGRDVVESNGKTMDLLKALGVSQGPGDAGDAASEGGLSLNAMSVAKGVLLFIGCFIGLLVADWICGFAWTAVFKADSGDRLTQWSLLKVVALIAISVASAFLVPTE
jgi:hypothetical protein